MEKPKYPTQRAALAVMTACGIAAANLPEQAMAQSTYPMRQLDLRSASSLSNPIAELWADRTAANNRTWQNVSGRPLHPGENAPSSILWSTFQTGNRKITATIFFGLECDSGPNDKDSTQGWSVCPARVIVSGQSGEKIINSSACYQYFPLRDGEEPPAGSRSYVSIDSNETSITFTATQDGQTVPSCTRSVRIPR